MCVPPGVHPSPAASTGLRYAESGPDFAAGGAIRQETLSRKAEEVGEGAWEGRGCFQPQPFPARPPEDGSREKLGGKRGAVRALAGGWEAARGSRGASR